MRKIMADVSTPATVEEGEEGKVLTVWTLMQLVLILLSIMT